VERLRPATGILLLFILFSTNVSAQTAKQPAAITIAGMLVRVAGIGGETTGWAIQLDSEIEVRGERMKSIEVSGDSREFERLENKHVEATGRLALRHGVTRGAWPVVQVSSIRESRAKP
jgi:hypothetical protein